MFKRAIFAAALLLASAPAFSAETIKSGHVLGNGTSAERTPADASLISVMGQTGSGLGSNVSTYLANPFGTGVGPALNLPINASGGFVTYSGALGTPTSGVLTNATGLPIAGISATGTPSNLTYLRGDGQWFTPVGSGTVTSVGLSLPAIFSVSGSPVTTTGTLTGTLAAQPANYVWAGPASGAAAAPTFRPHVCADLPAGSRCSLSTATASNSPTLSDTTNLTSTYAHYDIVCTNLVPATNATTIQLQVQTGGSFQSTGYVATGIQTSTGAAGTIGGITTAIPLSYLTYTANTSPGWSVAIHFDNPSQTTAPKIFNASGGGVLSTATYGVMQSSGYWNGNGAVTGWEILAASGNLTSGSCEMFGYN
jgi:hypothetical protein